VRWALIPSRSGAPWSNQIPLATQYWGTRFVAHETLGNKLHPSHTSMNEENSTRMFISISTAIKNWKKMKLYSTENELWYIYKIWNSLNQSIITICISTDKSPQQWCAKGHIRIHPVHHLFKFFKNLSQAWCHMPIIASTQEADAGGFSWFC
jgi:hypothetical protein